MAYMRGNPYVYSDGECMNFHYNSGSVRIPLEIVEEFCAMFWARLSQEQRQEACERAVRNYGGNFGADGLLEKMGEATSLDFLSAIATTTVQADERGGNPNERKRRKGE